MTLQLNVSPLLSVWKVVLPIEEELDPSLPKVELPIRETLDPSLPNVVLPIVVYEVSPLKVVLPIVD